MEPAGFPWEQQLVLDLSAWCPWSTHSSYWAVRTARDAQGGLQAAQGSNTLAAPPDGPQHRPRWRKLDTPQATSVFKRNLRGRSGAVINLLDEDGRCDGCAPVQPHARASKIRARPEEAPCGRPSTWSRASMKPPPDVAIDLEASPIDEAIVEGLWEALFLDEVYEALGDGDGAHGERRCARRL